MRQKLKEEVSKEKVSSCDCGEFGGEQTRDESLHGRDFCVFEVHLHRLAQMETESRLY